MHEDLQLERVFLINVEAIPAKCITKFKSVIIFGTVKEVNEDGKRRKILS